MPIKITSWSRKELWKIFHVFICLPIAIPSELEYKSKSVVSQNVF